MLRDGLRLHGARSGPRGVHGGSGPGVESWEMIDIHQETSRGIWGASNELQIPTQSLLESKQAGVQIRQDFPLRKIPLATT